MLYLIGIVISFFLVVLLATKKEKSEADRILTAWLLIMGVHLTLFYLYFTGTYISFPYFLGFELPLPLLHGPMLYLYTNALTNRPVLGKYRFIHFLPFTLAYIPMIPFLFQNLSYKIFVYQHQGQGYETLTSVIYIASVFSGIVYIGLALYSLYMHRKILLHQFSYTEKINLAWLRYLIWGTAVIWVGVIIGKDQYIYAVATLYVLFIGYFGIRQVGIFNTHLLPDADAINMSDPQPINPILLPNQKSENPAEKIKYMKSGLNEEEAKDIHKELIDIMQSDKLYLDPELTLVELAQKLKVHPNTLSQVINTKEQKNFYDFVNIRRIEEFKQVVLLPENQKFSLLGLAYQCGFNSKTSFNRNFKKSMGLTPSDYLKQSNIYLN